MPSLMTLVGMNATAFFATSEKVKQSVGSLGESITSNLGHKLSGIFAVSAIEHAALSMVELGGKIQDISNRTGLSTDEVQKWDFALKQNGSSIEAAIPFFQKLAIARKKALEGDPEAIQNLDNLGVSLKRLQSGERLGSIGETIAKTWETGDPQALMASMVAVGGKGAGAMVSAFRDGFADLMEEASIIPRKDIEALDAAGDAIDKLKNVASSVFAPLVAGTATFLKDFTETAEAALGGFVGGVQGAVETLSRMKWTDMLNPFMTFNKVATGTIDGVKEGWDAMADKFHAQDESAAKKSARLAKGNTAAFDPDEIENKAQTKLADEQEKKDRARQDRLAKMQDDLNAKEADNALIGLDPEQKRLALMARRLEMVEAIGRAQDEAEALGLDNEEEVLQRKIKLTGLDKNILGDAEREREQDAKLNKHSLSGHQSIGGFSGNDFGIAQGPEQALLNTQIQSLDILRSIDKNLETLAGQSISSADEGTVF